MTKIMPIRSLEKIPETELRFYQRLRDTPKIKDHDNNKDDREFKSYTLRNPKVKSKKKDKQLISTTVTTATTGNSNCQKI